MPGLALLGLLSYGAARIGLADWLAWVPAEKLDRWVTTRKPPALQPWMAVRSDLERAVALSPLDPFPPELLGSLHLLRAGPEFAEIALEHLLKSVALRPSSPYVWSNITVVRHRLGQGGVPLESALVTAWKLGPSEPETQRMVLDIGFALGDSAGAGVQAALSQALPVAMRRNPVETLGTAERYGRLDVACPLAGSDKRLKQTKWAELCRAAVGG